MRIVCTGDLPNYFGGARYDQNSCAPPYLCGISIVKSHDWLAKFKKQLNIPKSNLMKMKCSPLQQLQQMASYDLIIQTLASLILKNIFLRDYQAAVHWVQA